MVLKKKPTRLFLIRGISDLDVRKSFIYKKDEISISNPGGFRIELEAAKAGGVSDPRNTTLVNFLISSE